ncbi:hypothetical protein [Frigoribacterium sp. Leaf172]|uniref:hypothetical protein n=1 Tax=Frigoribacterium sp. Leaf172 TaxID=1736285 RepID=UPI0006F9DC1F|nr:hypothetical protein [Frigoribacterium sp. Leaf172]KQR66660.1 hypothetical protein ASF89_06365 [Frigoribacterium sp. Leaf172]
MTPTQPGTPTAWSRLRAVVVSARGADGREAFLTAATALGVLLVVRFALGLLALVGSAIGYSVTAFPSGFTATPVGQFLGSFVLYPFPFYVAAFATLVVARPIRARDGLGVVLRSTLVAGAVGTAALAVVGIVPGITLSEEGGTWANLALYLTTIPLSAGVVDTAVLALGGVLAWWWLRAGDTSPASDHDRSTTDDPADDEPGRDGEVDAVAGAPTPPVTHEARGIGTRTTPDDGSAPGRSLRETPSAPTGADDWSRYAPPPAPNESDR